MQTTIKDRLCRCHLCLNRVHKLHDRIAAIVWVCNLLNKNCADIDKCPKEEQKWEKN